MMGWIKTIPRRHLPLVRASAYPRRSTHLDWHIVHSSDFITWLNRTTHGLVLRKIVERKAGDRFIDKRIEVPKVSG